MPRLSGIAETAVSLGTGENDHSPRGMIVLAASSAMIRHFRVAAQMR